MKDFSTLYNLADTAGKSAVTKFTPNPMVVTSGNKNYFVADGVCGFAWIKFAGNTAWARWAKKMGYARSAYPKGLSIWVSDYNQSMQKKEVYAQAFAKTLRDNGVDAWAESRMD